MGLGEPRPAAMAGEDAGAEGIAIVNP